MQEGVIRARTLSNRHANLVAKPKMYRSLHLAGTPHVLSNKELCMAMFILVISVITALYRGSYLPAPEPFNAPVTVFSEERARVYLLELLSLGPHRTVGSEANEVKAPAMILREVDKIVKETGAKIETDRQYGSGSFSLDFLGGFTSVYGQVQNVLVMLHGTQHSPEEGVLMISAHYDSPVGTRGASDNAANVANMIEILRVLAHDRPKYSCLFMFTGAEETILQGSHSFANSGHRWVPLVKGFINLEAAGSGGRELMFQATDARLALAWAKASPYPHGSIVGQEVFQSGIIPSDTDFRMYVAELNIPGMDMANVDNGHNYHTILDNAVNVDVGSMQRYGSNVLAIARDILNDDAFWSASPSSGKQLFVFFDVLGLFVVVIPPVVAYILIIVGSVILFAFFRATLFISHTDTMERDAKREARLRTLKLLGRCLFYPFLTSLLLTKLSPLTYYSRLWFTPFLYISPSLYGVVTAIATAHNYVGAEAEKESERRVSLSRKELLTFSVALFCWAVLAAVLIFFGKGSFYLAFAWSVIPAFARLISALGWREIVNILTQTPSDDLVRVRLLALESKKAAIAGGIYGVIIPLMLTLPLLLVVLSFFIPITGRSGSLVPGDVIVALVCGFCTFLLFLVPSSILTLAPTNSLATIKRVLRDIWLGSIFVAILFRIILGPGSSSFSQYHPKRIYAIHVDAVSGFGTNHAETESFLWIIDADSTSSDSVLNKVFESNPVAFKSDKVSKVDCLTSEKVYCGMPWFLPLKKAIPQTRKIPAAPSAPNAFSLDECPLKLKKQENVDDNTRRLHLCLGARERANIFFRDAENGGPTKWSFTAPLAPTDGHLYLLVANGIIPEGDGTCFWVEVPRNKPQQVAWACENMDNVLSPELLLFLDAIPKWSTPVAFVARWRDTVF